MHCRMPADSKLGAQKAASAITPLHAVHPQGGLVPMTVCTIQRVMKPVVRPPEGPAEAAGIGDDALRVQSWPYLLPCCGTAAG